MNILPPSFKFDGDKDKATSYKAYAGQFYKLITTQAAKEGVPHVTRTKIFPDGTIINFKAQKNSLFKNWSGRVEIYASPSGEPPSLLAPWGITYWYNSPTYFRRMDGSIFKGGRAPFTTTPILELGAFDPPVYNSNVEILLAQHQNTFDKIRGREEDGFLVFNGPYDIAGIFKATSVIASTDSNRISTTNMSAKGLSVTSTGNTTIDGYHNKGYSLVTSVTQQNEDIHGYLDKIVKDTLTNKIDIHFDNFPLKLEITTNHTTLGTTVTDLTSSIPALVYYSNPRFITLHLSPDGKYLSATISKVEEFDFSTGTKYTIVDIILKLDNGELWLDTNTITSAVNVITSYATDTPNKPDYRDAIDANVSIYINIFNFFESCMVTQVTNLPSFPSASGYNYTDISEYIPEGTGTGPGPSFTPYTFLNEGIVRPGTYESDFEALITLPLVGAVTYTYSDSRTSCFTSASFNYDASSIYGVPATIGTTSIPGIKILADFGTSGTYTETYTISRKGSPVLGSVYTKEKYADNEYVRYWLDSVLKFKDKSNLDVSVPVTYTETIYGKRAGMYNPGISTIVPLGPGNFTFYNADDVAILDSLALQEYRTGVVSTDARLLNEVKINDKLVAELRVGGVARLPLDTAELAREFKYTLDFVYSGSTPFPFQPTITCNVPYCKDLTKTSTAVLTDELFMSVGSSDFRTDYCYIFDYNNKINILNNKVTTNHWNKARDATLTGTHVANFTNGYQVTDTDFSVISKVKLDLSEYPTEVITNIAESTSNTSTSTFTISKSTNSLPNIVGTTGSFTEVEEALTAHGNIMSSFDQFPALYFALSATDFLAYSRNDFNTGQHPTRSYFSVLNGLQMPNLQNITAFNSFTTSSKFGIGFSI